MQVTEISSSEAKNKVSDLLKKLCCVTLSTIGTAGYPNSRLLALGAVDGTETIWLSTSIESRKVAEIQSNPKVSLYGSDLESFMEFRLFGTMEVLTDMDSRKKVWKEDYLQYWPDGIESPDMAVLKFSVNQGEFCSMTEKGTF